MERCRSSPDIFHLDERSLGFGRLVERAAGRPAGNGIHRSLLASDVYHPGRGVHHHPGECPAYEGRPGCKTDVKDSEWLADLLRHGLLKVSFLPPAPIRELRDLSRHRRTLVRQRADEANRLQRVLEIVNIKLASVATNVPLSQWTRHAGGRPGWGTRCGRLSRSGARALVEETAAVAPDVGGTGTTASALPHTVTHSILVIICHILKTPYRELGADYFEQLDTARLQRRAVQQLEHLDFTVPLAPKGVA